MPRFWETCLIRWFLQERGAKTMSNDAHDFTNFSVLPVQYWRQKLLTQLPTRPRGNKVRTTVSHQKGCIFVYVNSQATTNWIGEGKVLKKNELFSGNGRKNRQKLNKMRKLDHNRQICKDSTAAVGFPSFLKHDFCRHFQQNFPSFLILASEKRIWRNRTNNKRQIESNENLMRCRRERETIEERQCVVCFFFLPGLNNWIRE